ncbi:glutamate racemase [Pseudomonadota bacterium]
MIGVFDSGVGGLTVLKEFLRELPKYDYMYLGDSARTPYGNRSRESVMEFTKQGIDFLFEKGCTLIIIACNTASATVLREIQEEYLRKPKVTDKKILGVLRPVVEEVAGISKKGRIGVVGTKGTINSGSYELELKHLKKDIKVFGQACPLLVPLIEEGYLHKPATHMILREYLRSLKSKNIDTLILGCTHYPALYSEFKKMIGSRVNVPHPGEIVARSLKDYLKRHDEIEGRLTKKGGRHFYTTDDPERFKEIGKIFIGNSIKKVEKCQVS